MATVATPHTRTINGVQVNVKAYTLSENRYFDGRDFHYIEVDGTEAPEGLDADHYHTWNLTNGRQFSGWLVEAV